MNSRALSATGLTTAGALFAAGSAGMTPGQNAVVFGTTGAIRGNGPCHCQTPGDRAPRPARGEFSPNGLQQRGSVH